jgi:hypothetical protein
MSDEPGRDTVDLNYGPRLSAAEYEQRIIGLYRGLPPMPTKAQDESICKQALNLKIDHRLGINFPQERREALWGIQRRVESRRVRLVFAYVLRRVFAKLIMRKAQNLAGFMVGEYARVLTKDELKAYFDLEEGQRPSLPIDADQLRK